MKFGELNDDGNYDEKCESVGKRRKRVGGRKEKEREKEGGGKEKKRERERGKRKKRKKESVYMRRTVTKTVFGAASARSGQESRMNSG